MKIVIQLPELYYLTQRWLIDLGLYFDIPDILTHYYSVLHDSDSEPCCPQSPPLSSVIYGVLFCANLSLKALIGQQSDFSEVFRGSSFIISEL